MTRALLIVAATLAGAGVVVGVTSPTLLPDRRVHRLQALPPDGPAPTTLARALSVDEVEWALRPTRIRVASGQVEVNIYNRGMDDHDLAIYDAGGRQIAKVDVPTGDNRSLAPILLPGNYRVVCSLFAGTSASHEALGMRFDLTVE